MLVAFSKVIFVTTLEIGVRVLSSRVEYFRNLGLLVTGTRTSRGIFLFAIGKSSKDGRRYIYLDYEPLPDTQGIQFRQPATYTEIKTWVLREYGLVVISRYIAQVKRKHGIFTSSRFGTVPENIKIPPEKETAIEAALRHFHMI